MPERITKLLVDLVFPIAGVIMFSFAAYAVWRQRWFRVRPLLSVYVWVPDKPIRRKAAKGFGIAACSVMAGAGILGCAAPDARTLPGAANVLSFLTAIALIFSSIYILNIKKSRSLFANSRMAVVFWFLVLQSFTDILIFCLLRNREQIRSVIYPEIWVGFTVFLYLALKNGPQPRADQIGES
jgi:hypothetical protein